MIATPSPHTLISSVSMKCIKNRHVFITPGCLLSLLCGPFVMLTCPLFGSPARHKLQHTVCSDTFPSKTSITFLSTISCYSSSSVDSDHMDHPSLSTHAPMRLGSPMTLSPVHCLSFLGTPHESFSSGDALVEIESSSHHNRTFFHSGRFDMK